MFMVGATNSSSANQSANRTPDEPSSPSKRQVVRQTAQEKTGANLVRSATDRLPSSTHVINLVSRGTRTASTSSSTIMPHSISIVTSSAPMTTAKLVASSPGTSVQQSPVQSTNSDLSSAAAERSNATTKTVDGLPPLPNNNNKVGRRLSMDVASNSTATSNHHHITVASKIKSFFTRGSRATKSTKSKAGCQMSTSTTTWLGFLFKCVRPQDTVLH